LLLLLLPGCAYYNGMYNARRWAAQAERAERAGREADARDRWRRAVLHADSLLARHPRSRWADDALLVRGRALVHLKEWDGAAEALGRAADRAGEHEQCLEALLLLGRTQLARGRFGDARAALDSAVTSSAAPRRAEALLYRGRVALAMGDAAAALEDFRASAHADAGWGRAQAALALRDAALAAATADSLAGERRYVEGTWLPLLDSLGAAGGGAHASRLVDRLVQRGDVGRGQRARLLLADGARLVAAGDEDGAQRRMRDVQRIVPDSVEARLAGVRLARFDLEAAPTDAALAEIRERLLAIQRQGGAAAPDAQRMMHLLDRADTLSRALVTPDAFWFLRAELFRDSLGAPRLAAAAFAEMAVRFPRSPWTPKALVAAIAADHPAPDSLRALLEEHYGENPYTLALLRNRAEAAERYAVLEDSLQQALSQRAVPRREAAAAAQAADDELDPEERISPRRPGGRLRPPQGQQRPAQPSPRPRETPPRADP
jgi:predicted negative regulator of RcsB-dependent stress response